MTSSRPAATPARFPTSDRQRILNRDVWTVTGVDDDGSLHVKHAPPAASAVLPASYVADDVVLGYATTIAGAQGRTVDRGHVVVTPRTTSASLYVGMSRGRDSNHAHVVCDSHDHTEFELGDLTGEQAFAAATQRDPAGQLSAHSVQQRWETGRSIAPPPEPPTANDARSPTGGRHASERSHPQCAPPSPADHHQILDVLVRLPNNDSHDKRSTAPRPSVNWRKADAADQFLQRLQRTSTTTGRHHPTQPQAEQNARRER